MQPFRSSRRKRERAMRNRKVVCRRYYQSHKRQISVYYKRMRMHRAFREYHVGKTKEWRKRNPTGVRNSMLKSCYGITLLDYERMLKSQNGKCAICTKPFSKERLRNLVIDHNHTTGKIRGLLCQACNKGLGFFGDNVILLLRAIRYMRRKHERR